MRSYTFVLSLVAHAVMIGAAIVAPIFATGDLPEVPHSSTYVLVTPAAPDIPPPAPRPTAAAPAPHLDAAPIVPPEGIQPEPLVDRGAPPVFGDVVPGDAGIPASFGPADGVIAPPPPPLRPSAPMRTGGDLRPPQKVHHVAPAYPSIARSARISGTVILDATIAEDGTVQDVRVLRSIALLDAAAVDAVRQWRFTPTLLNGVPVRVLMTVTVSFGLN
jgi:protein TonB